MTSLVTFNIKHIRVNAPHLGTNNQEFRAQYESVVLAKGNLSMAFSEYELASMRFDDPYVVRIMRARLVHSMMCEIKAVLEDEVDRQRVFSPN